MGCSDQEKAVGYVWFRCCIVNYVVYFPNTPLGKKVSWIQ